ncbi:MAG: ABC transporter permease, partial [bacterium]
NRSYWSILNITTKKQNHLHGHMQENLVKYNIPYLRDSTLVLLDTGRGMIAGYLMWLFAASSIQTMSSEISEEAMTGTMEQVCLSPPGPICILLARTISGVLFSFISLPIVYYILQILTGIYLEINLWSILPILILTFFGMCGFGFILAGITLVFKRIGLLLDLIPLILFGLAMLPIETLPNNLQIFSLTFPLTLGVKLVRLILLKEQSLIHLLKNGEILLLFLNSSFYFLVGIFGYKIADKIARDRGLLGHY